MCECHLPIDKRRKLRRAIEVEYSVYNELESFIEEIMLVNVESDEEASSKYQSSGSVQKSRRHSYATNRGVVKRGTVQSKRVKHEHVPSFSGTAGKPMGNIKKRIDIASLAPYQPRLYVNKADHEVRRKGKGWL